MKILKDFDLRKLLFGSYGRLFHQKFTMHRSMMGSNIDDLRHSLIWRFVHFFLDCPDSNWVEALLSTLSKEEKPPPASELVLVPATEPPRAMLDPLAFSTRYAPPAHPRCGLEWSQKTPHCRFPPMSQRSFHFATRPIPIVMC